MKKKKYQNILLILFSIVVFLLIFEIILSFSNINAKLLWPILFFVDGEYNYQNGEDIYIHSVNSNKLYELKPNNSVTCFDCFHKKETKYTNTTITVNNLGFRDYINLRNSTKKSGVKRIIILGGSNTFGDTVNDQDTYPAQLEKKLNQKYKNRFEVWNAGLSSYVMSQKISYAKEIIKKYDPDILIFQDLNRGRRAFSFYDKEYYKFFKKNPYLYLENIPFFFIEKYPKKLHTFFVLNSNVYRFFLIQINKIIIQKQINDPKSHSQLWFGFTKIDSRFSDYLLPYYLDEEKINREWMKNTIQTNNISILIFDPILKKYCPNRNLIQNITHFSRCENKSEEYYVVHPPSYVYEDYAIEIMKFLEEEGLVS